MPKKNKKKKKGVVSSEKSAGDTTLKKQDTGNSGESSTPTNSKQMSTCEPAREAPSSYQIDIIPPEIVSNETPDASSYQVDVLTSIIVSNETLDASSSPVDVLTSLNVSNETLDASSYQVHVLPSENVSNETLDVEALSGGTPPQEGDDEFGTVTSMTTPEAGSPPPTLMDDQTPRDEGVVTPREEKPMRPFAFDLKLRYLTRSDESDEGRVLLTPAVTCEEPSEGEADCGGVWTRKRDDLLAAHNPKTSRRYFDAFKDALVAVRARCEQFDMAPLVQQVDKFKDSIFDEESWAQILTKFNHLRTTIEDRANTIRQRPLVQRLLKAAEDSLKRLGAFMKAIKSSSVLCMRKAHTVGGCGLRVIASNKKMTSTLEIPKSIREGRVYVTSRRYVKKAIDRVPPPKTIIVPIADTIGRSGKHVAKKLDEKLAVVDKVYWINDRFGVSVYAVKLDRKFDLADKIELVTVSTIDKVQLVCRNSKVSNLIDHARQLDDAVSAGKMHDVAVFGYDEVSRLWRRYVEYKRALILASPIPPAA